MSIKLKQITLSNIIHYITGNVRYFFFKNKVKNLNLSFMKDAYDDDWENSTTNTKASHTQEQFLYRIFSVQVKSPNCLSKGACVICGCDTPELLFANKACDGNCYPPMMNKKEWSNFKTKYNVDMIKTYQFVLPYLIEKKIVTIKK